MTAFDELPIPAGRMRQRILNALTAMPSTFRVGQIESLHRYDGRFHALVGIHTKGATILQSAFDEWKRTSPLRFWL